MVFGAWNCLLGSFHQKLVCRMINAFRITGPEGGILLFDLAVFPPPHGLLLIDVKGLGQAAATVNSSSGVYQPGGVFTFAKHMNRTITLTLTVSDSASGDTSVARQLLYKHLVTGMKSKFEVRNGSNWYWIDVYPEDYELNVFSKNENFDITMLCPYPFFRPTSPTVQVVTPTIAASSIVPSYLGHVKSPVDIELNFTASAAGNITVQNQTVNLNNHGSMTINAVSLASIIGRAILPGDKIHIKTGIGEKSITHQIGWAIPTNIMGALVRGATWINIHPGTDNYLTMSSSESFTGTMTVTYYVQYLGV